MILSETPETYGAEHLLTRRAVSREVGEKLVALMRWWEEYTAREGAEMNANPSPGNKAGGLTTILEKSLGAMAKAGSTNLVDVLNYAEAVTKKGFVFMDTPGYDPVAATGQVAGRRQPGLLYHRPRQRVRLQARALDQARHQFGDVPAHGRRYGRQLRHHPRQQGNRAAMRPANFRADAGNRLGQADRRESFDFGGAEFAPWVLGATM